MDKNLALSMLDFIEKQALEIATLRATLLTVSRTASTEKIDALVGEAMADPEARGKVHEYWLPLRRQLESDSSLEEALKQFVRIAPPSKDVN